MRDFLSITKALADESRVRVLMFLRGGELCVCQIIEMLGLAPSTVSKHMAILVQAGLVERRKNGKWHYYRLPGKDASSTVQDALKWTQAALAKSPVVSRDTKRLKVVIKMDIKDLCTRYKPNLCG
ncbi:MAG TPA: metalloregulator ArsR/SmtB family transcription factor [Candidatus Hydrogenedentes bacterium]|nr:metalloregulator ArsR/SmtB family transcription factor [Candidatus Hydrogenedentota bacterium]HOV73287.1 metalloregulator ArsR/SmtB family transcription factor [Candidatus Hydrogenedentota bacterium]HPC16113.1 metalloregulator ArsR/SmtB family transcription factor [Candidatus Hydrogenedentota bacterium]HRT18871.1 metalloregulator ArsR/SmtB family transcription factor [Candidatus Hydrogenedentota bacterium]HRT65596.1 metalloregulator ArsR/SmtB family transcription factor [Candidatus Hydrogene